MGGKYLERLWLLKSVLARQVKPVVEVDAARFCWNPSEPQSAAALTCDNLCFLLHAELRAQLRDFTQWMRFARIVAS